MTVTAPKKSKARDAYAARTALELKAQGWPLKEIADTLGVSQAEATAILQKQYKEFKEINTELAEMERDLAITRNDQLIRDAGDLVKSLKTRAREGDTGAATGVTKAMEILLKADDRRAKLMGLDAAKEVSVEIKETTKAREQLLERVGVFGGNIPAAQVRS